MSATRSRRPRDLRRAEVRSGEIVIRPSPGLHSHEVATLRLDNLFARLGMVERRLAALERPATKRDRGSKREATVRPRPIGSPASLADLADASLDALAARLDVLDVPEGPVQIDLLAKTP